MTMGNASPASAAFGVRLRFVLRFIKPQKTHLTEPPPVTSLVRHPVKQLREATRRSVLLVHQGLGGKED
jgi:hypothetical protein